MAISSPTLLLPPSYFLLMLPFGQSQQKAGQENTDEILKVSFLGTAEKRAESGLGEAN